MITTNMIRKYISKQYKDFDVKRLKVQKNKVHGGAIAFLIDNKPYSLRYGYTDISSRVGSVMWYERPENKRFIDRKEPDVNVVNLYNNLGGSNNKYWVDN